MSEIEREGDAEVLSAAESEALARLGRPRVPEMVRDLAGRARRGRSIAAIAAEGSGKEILYALTAADRADPDSPALQALVLSPTRDGCLRAARAMHEFGMAPGLTAVAWLPWSEGEPAGGAPSDGGAEDQPPFGQLLAGRPDELLPRVRAGRLGLADLEVLVLDGVTALEETGQWPSVEAILDTLPPDAQKIVVDSRGGERFADLLKRQLTRAHRWPPELFSREGGATVGDGAAPSGDDADRLLWSAAGAEEERLERLAVALRRVSRTDDTDRAFVACRDEATAHRVAHSLAVRGFELSEETDAPGIVVAWGEEEPPPGVVAFYGLPDLAELRRWLGAASRKIVVIGNEELPQLRIVARRAGWPLSALPEPVPPAERDRVGRFRRRVRRRALERDDSPELLVLEPLLEEFGGARTAAALGGMLREVEARRKAAGEAEARRDEAAPARPETRAPETREPAAPATSGARSGAAKPRREGVGSARTRLFINAGKRDGVGPGDLVGAITGETGAVGGQIGRIEVKGSFSLVDVDSQVADEVMEKMKGASIKGREVIVRPDRES